MAGEIKHEWSGTTLVITSDSGTSGCDLKGRVGDIGPRGAQGPCGVVYDANGNIVSNIFVTKEELNELLGEFGKTDVIYHGTGIHFNYVNPTGPILTNYTYFDATGATSYRFRVVYADGTEEVIDTVLQDASGVVGASIGDKSARLASVIVNNATGQLIFLALNEITTDEYIEELEITLTSGEPVYIPLNAQLIPVDNQTIKINENGKIYAVETDLSNYVTKDEVNQVAGNFATKAYVDEVAGSAFETIIGLGYQTAEQVNTAIAEALNAIGVAEEGAY